MREKQVSATEFKAKCLGLLDEVASGTSLVITKRGKPVARVTRASPRSRPLMGGMAGTAEEAGDIVHFESSEMWELLR
jgi:prevent-host-death family protein